MEPLTDQDTRSVDELVELAEAIPASMGLADGLATIRGTASGTGISLAVDLHGMLVELDLDDRALKLGAHTLAEEISTLVSEAAANALQQGMRAITAGCVPWIANAVAEQVGIEDEPQDEQEKPAASRPEPRPGRSSEPTEEEPDGGFRMEDAWTT
jgi:hypothetical protein